MGLRILGQRSTQFFANVRYKLSACKFVLFLPLDLWLQYFSNGIIYVPPAKRCFMGYLGGIFIPPAYFFSPFPYGC